MWRDVRNELRPKGFEVVTVALDAGGVDAARPFIEAAQPTHPSLIDRGHLLDELFGVVNVPSGIWIDEEGMIVRPPEPAFPGRSIFAEIVGRNAELPEGTDPYIVESLAMARRIQKDPELYLAALRDWVARGPESSYALAPGEVVARSRPRPFEEALAAAHFELGQHLHAMGHAEDAVPHFREAHRLQPDNWTYKRQAWSFLDPLQRPSDQYEGDWAGDIAKIGPENYYPALDMERSTPPSSSA